MSRREDKPSQERAQTDTNLRAERKKSDHALEERIAAEKEARRLLDAARDSADALLLAARNKADDERQAGTGQPPRASMIEQRVADDETLQVERDSADD